MLDKPPTTVNVPESEVARQATDALGGYVYQLDQTVMTWLTLDEDEALHVEFAEDVAVSGDGRLGLTQVKRVQANITLRSAGVAKLIVAVWEFQKKNPSRRVTGALLTTSGIGKEKGKLSFPGRVPGLVYWRIAARDGADVEPIRSALLCLDLPKDLRSFIGDAPADALRSRIIRPLQWVDRRPSPDDLRRDVEEQLVHLGARMGVPAVPAKNTRDFLVVALLDSICQAPAKRSVTRADLLTIFQKKTFITLPPNLFQSLPLLGPATQLTPVDLIVRDVAAIPLARRAATRAAAVHHLQQELVSHGALWFHGSSGLGKSTLAVLVARSQSVAWRIADLRDAPAAAVRSILVGIASSFRQTGARGLILDDVPADADNALISAIGQVTRAVTDVDAVLVLTSMKPPQPTLAARLGIGPQAIIHVPYLTEEDVAQMVRAAGADPQKWARVIRAFAGGGHPQLVDARVAGLEQRGWDEKELLADIVPLKNTPDDMAEERKAVRNRVLQELQPGATELLLRLSLLTGNFDRPMALVGADTPIAIPQAGLVFDFLVGPWIEQLGPERYRLSPLLKDSGAAALSQPLQAKIKTRVLHHLIGQNPFPADQLLQVFLIAVQQDDREGLTWFGHAILAASTGPKKNQFKRLAQEVFPFALFDRGSGNPLVPGDASLSRLLRFAQLRVAVAADDMKQAAVLVDRALAENASLAPVERQMVNALVYTMVMLEPQIPIGPKRWLPMLLELIATPEIGEMFTQPLPTGDMFGGLPPTASHEEMLFIARATAVKSAEQLAELIEALEEQPKAVRDRYLGAAARTNQSLHVIVSASWLVEVKRPGFDARAAAATFRELSQSDIAQHNTDLAVELLCAEAIMLDEYADDNYGALEVLRAAQEVYPTDYRLNRQRQKVFYRHNQHAEALAEFEKFQDRFPKERAVDRAFAMREAGRSAAEVGDLGRARTLFGEAWESARLCGDAMKPMTAGLSADCAILAFDAGNNEEALDLMRRALLEADDLDPSAGLRQAFVKRVHLAAILYMRGAAPDFPAARQARVYGMCSDSEPQEWFRTQRQAQPLFVWYQLAELEAEISQSRAVYTELRKRTASGGLLPLETMLASRLAEAAARDLDVDRFLEALHTYPRAVVEGIRNLQGVAGGDPFNMPAGNLAPIASEEWKDAQISESTKNAVLSFLLTAAAKGRADVIGELRDKVRAAPGLADVVAQLFQIVDNPSDAKTDIHVIIASTVSRLLKGDIVDTNDVYHSSIFAIQFLQNSTLAPPAAGALMAYYEQLWPEILDKRTFSMRGPATNGPIILAALAKGDTAMQRMANMILVTEAAARPSLSDNLRDQIAKIAAKRTKPDPVAEE
jgi:tetratricopeptide (TPR) repeat protein